MSTILDAARAGYRAGLCLLPTRDDGSKAPAVASWRQYQTVCPAPDNRRAFAFETRSGFGMIAGVVSGCRECWDFDTADVFDAFITAARDCGLGAIVDRLRAGYEDQTPGGGRRWIVRYPVSVTWQDCTLARRPGRDGEPAVKTTIELPTFAILAPSNGATHPSGRPYVRVSGDVTTIARYTVDERDALIELARSFDEMPRPVAAPARTPRTSDGQRPGDAFAAATTWPALLEPAGWAHVFNRGDVAYWCRPGKRNGVSASTNYGGSDLFFPFTSSSEFHPDQSYSKFAVYATLHHGGNFAAAARALSHQGYGQPSSRATSGSRGTTPPPPPVFSRPAVAIEPGACLLEPLPGVPYSGWCQRGAVHLFSGPSGSGKTTIVLDALLRQRRSELVFGHRGGGWSFLVCFADRGRASNAETLQRMHIDANEIPIAHLPIDLSRSAVQAVLAAVEAQPTIPEVVFIEGGDLVIADPHKPACVAQFISGVRSMAEHYGIAVVLSVGAPKSKPNELHVLQRDRVYGSQAWSRLCDTVAIVSLDGDNTSDRRSLLVLHRNAAPESFALVFTDGRLTVEPGTTPVTGQTVDAAMRAWFAETEVFTKQMFKKAFRLSGTRASEILDGYLSIGVLRVRLREGELSRYYCRRIRPGSPAHEDRDKKRTEKKDTDPHDDPREIRVPNFEGKDTGFEGSPPENLKVFVDQDPDSLIPQKSVLSSFSSVDGDDKRTKGQVFLHTPRAREGGAETATPDQLPAWVAEPEPPMLATDPEAPFADRDAADPETVPDGGCF